MNNHAFDLFMITTSLSQLKDRDRVITLFIESISNIFPDMKFRWSNGDNLEENNYVEVCTINDCYGYITYSELTTPSDTILALIHNACQLLGIILEKIEAEQKLLNQNQLFEQIAEERTQLAEELEQRVIERTNEMDKNREEIIRQNGLLSILLETLPVGIFMVEVPSGKQLVANEASLQILGRGVLPNTSNKNLAEVYNVYKSSTRTPYPVNEMPIILGMKGIPSHIDDMLIIRPDGTERLLEIFGAPITDAQNKVWASLVTFIDITERKMTENALRESQELFSLFMSHSPIYTYIKDATPTESRVVEASDNYIEMIGIPGKEMIGKTMHDLFSGDFADKMTADDWDVISNGNVLKLDEELNDRYYTTVKFPISHGNKNLMAGYTIDITEQKQAEITLQESEKKYRSVIETISLLGVVLDKDGNITMCNDFLLNLTGWQRDEVLYKNWFDIFMPEDIKEMMKFEVFQSSISSGKLPEHFENDIITKKGERRLIAWNNIVNRDQKGNIIGITSIGEDITERKKAEDALRESEQHFRTLANSGQALIWTAGLDKKCNYFNQPWLDFTGRTMEQEIGDGWVESVHPDDLDYCFNTYTTAFDKREPFSMNYRMLRHDGEYRIIQDDGSPRYNTLGEFIGYIGHCLDITNRKRAEEAQKLLEQQIQQTQKLESLGVLAGGIAHDFNNILMAVLGYAELAQMELSPVSPARDSISNIITGALRAAELCRQMLAYSGKATFAMEKLNVGELVEEMTHLLKTSISKKALLNLHIDRNIPLIDADPSQMRQIVMNLIINASDAIGDRSGVISVSVGATRCNEEYLRATELYNVLVPGLYVHIEVADTGCGMDAETRSRIFEPFYTTKFTGRGLGLAAVMGIVQAHKGAMKVYSEPGKGTTFKVLLPASEISMQITQNGNIGTVSDWQGAGTILFADDEESIRAIGAQMLEHLGYSVITAEDGRKAVEIYKLREKEINIVILDMTMPHMDGAEAFSELRQINPQVKVILASGYSKDDIGSRFAGKGLMGVLQKPFTVGTLLEMLKSIEE
ncbi:MAG: PAS domain S-box protein [bacterium]